MQLTFSRCLSYVACLLILVYSPTQVYADNARSLLARHKALQQQLDNNPFNRPVYLESGQEDSKIAGDIYAEIQHPFAVAGKALKELHDWCDVLILHLNTKSCQARASAEGDSLSLYIGRKYPQELKSATLVNFDYVVQEYTPDYLEVMLDAEKGPMGTSLYRIILKMTPLDDETSFLHLQYSYEYNMMAKMAMEGYLATIGRDKVGFSVAGYDNKGDVEYVQGMRAAVERNTMRYYLAIDTFLDSLSVPPPQRTEMRLNDWFSNSEHYARQLHEIGRDEYLTMKRAEIQRQNRSGRQRCSQTRDVCN